MNVFVNILKILIIIVAMAVAVVVILCGALVLFPGFSLFGLHYISGDNKEIGKEYKLNTSEWATIDTIWVKTTAWDIEMHPKTSFEDNIFVTNSINARWTHLYNGFVFGDVQEPSFEDPTVVTVDNDKRLLFEVKEPDGGWLSKNNTLLKIFYEASDFDGKNILIETKSGKITLGNDVSFDAGALTINSLNGEVVINKVNFSSDVDINKLSGNIDVNVDLPVNVSIDITDGFGKVELQDVATTNKSLTMEKMKNSNIQIGNVNGGFLLGADGGLVRCGNVAGLFSAAVASCDVYLNNVGGRVDFNSGDGSLNIETANSDVFAKSTGKGNISIKNCKNKVDINTERGKIELFNTINDVKASSQNGYIDIKGDTNSTNKVKYIVTNRNGDTNLSNIKGTVNFSITDKGKGKVTVKFVNSSENVGNVGLFGENIITTETGAIEILLDANDKFFFKNWSTNNDVNIQLSGLQTKEKKSENVAEANRFVNGGNDTSNNLTVISTAGPINIDYYSL